MIYSVNIGKDLDHGNWEVITDKYGSKFISNSLIHQRMRIDKSIDIGEDRKLVPGESTKDSEGLSIDVFDVDEGLKWMNNPRNMNPLLIKSEEEDFHEIIVYLTISNRYSLSRFYTPHRILQTYHLKYKFQGCAVVINRKDLKENPEFINIKVFDNEEKKFKEIKISESQVEIFDIKNPKVIANLKEQRNKFSHKYYGFKVIARPGDLLTSTYFVDTEATPDITSISSQGKGTTIIQIDKTKYLKDKKYKNDCLTNLSKVIKTYKIRAVTVSGIKLDIKFIRESKLLYVFEYEPEKNLLICKKSN
jgi:hypothetical protein